MTNKKSFKTNPAMQFISTAHEEPPAMTAEFTVPKGYKLVRESKSERMHLLIRPATKQALKEAAAAQGVSTNDLVNTIFEEYLEERGII